MSEGKRYSNALLCKVDIEDEHGTLVRSQITMAEAIDYILDVWYGERIKLQVRQGDRS